jgi:hypothetical protein
MLPISGGAICHSPECATLEWSLAMTAGETARPQTIRDIYFVTCVAA